MAVFGWNAGCVIRSLQISFKIPQINKRDGKTSNIRSFLNIHRLAPYSRSSSLHTICPKDRLRKTAIPFTTKTHLYHILVFDHPPTWTSMLVKLDHLPTKVTRNNTEKKHPRATTQNNKSQNSMLVGQHRIHIPDTNIVIPRTSSRYQSSLFPYRIQPIMLFLCT